MMQTQDSVENEVERISSKDPNRLEAIKRMK
jgi:hypothetical protein